MPSESSIFCKIFVNSTHQNIVDLLREMGGKADKGDTFNIHDNEIDVIMNGEYNEATAQQFPDGFLAFMYYIEIEGRNETQQQKLVTQILSSLWKRNIPAIAACDYEHKLPQHGGYNSHLVPWPQ
jgi:hypothetical protein